MKKIELSDWMTDWLTEGRTIFDVMGRYDDSGMDTVTDDEHTQIEDTDGFDIWIKYFLPVFQDLFLLSYSIFLSTGFWLID